MTRFIEVDQQTRLDINDVEFSAIRSQGAGGQNVNKVSTAIHLRFNIKTASLPEQTKARLLKMSDHRITSDGLIIIKSQATRSQETNKLTAIEHLVDLIKQANIVPKKRKATKPTKASVRRRLEHKANRKSVKQNRKKVSF